MSHRVPRTFVDPRSPSPPGRAPDVLIGHPWIRLVVDPQASMSTIVAADAERERAA